MKKYLLFFIVIAILFAGGLVFSAKAEDLNKNVNNSFLSKTLEGLIQKFNQLQLQFNKINQLTTPAVTEGKKNTNQTISKTGYLTLEEVSGNPSVSCVIPEMKQGSGNKSVYLLQMVLKQAGYYPEGFITGYYGKLTTKAVQAFQKGNNLTPNSGHIDSQTANALNQLVYKYYPTECSETTPPIIIPPITYQEFKGDLKASDVSIQMWGTHTLTVNDFSCEKQKICLQMIRNTTYRVKAANDEVLTQLKKYEGQNVYIWGYAEYINLEGGFYGITAYKVSGVNDIEPPLLGGIKVFSPLAGESWYIGNTYKIRWASGMSSDVKMKITLAPPRLACLDVNPPCMTAQSLIAEVAPYTITESTENDGVFEWTIPELSGHYFSNQQITVQMVNGSTFGRSGTFMIKPKEVSENKPPVISGTTAPSILKIGETGTWTIKAYDPEGGSLSYSINWGDEASVTSDRKYITPSVLPPYQQGTFTHVYNAAGVYYPKFTITDDKGQTVQTSLSVTVN